MGPAENRAFGSCGHDRFVSNFFVQVSPVSSGLGTRPGQHRVKLLEDFLVAKLQSSDCPFAPGLCEIEAGMFEDQPRAVTFRFELVGDPRIDQRPAGPGMHQPAGRIAFQYLALNHDAFEAHLGIGRHREGELMADTRFEVVRIHPLGERVAVGDRLPNLLARLRDEDFFANCPRQFLFPLESNFCRR